ncbi:MAG: DEAD/DEAH box helicase family protein [Blastocatellia bacterium]|nr:DEAD/DEAH box helicase family protein [Blastocatellia bacterium]
MKIQFDPKQQYQLDAVNAVVELFDGQPLEKPDYSVIFQTMDTELFAGQARTELGVGNKLHIGPDKLLENLKRVQERNDLDLAKEVQGWMWAGANESLSCPHFSVEMETGTGKTYVYLRTIFELNRKYGFKKFIIVVPSVAIREGVLKNLEITAEHFRALFNNVEFEHFVYDAKKVNKLRQFATSNTIQVLVINIDAFRKNFTGTETENRSNVIYKENDKLSGRQPIEFVQATRPIVIIDEPQSVDSTDKAQEAIRALNPLCTLRYSATHRNPYNLVYQLDPIRAYELRLVKQIVVASATAGDALNGAFVKVKSVGYDGKAKRPTAKLAIHVQTKEGVKEKEFKVKGGEDLHLLSGERACYQDNWVVDNVDATPGAEHVAFTNGRSLNAGQEVGGMRDDVWRVQIENTVRKHLEKELQVRGKGLKVLTLFFIDKVANYRAYDEEGKPAPGKFATEFEATFRKLILQERYRELAVTTMPLEQLHNGYFAADKKGVLKDTSGTTKDDDDVYALIMRNKEQLLSLEEPLRFIFSHSALREGWDNPNVFQICTLNETRSATKKRQEIGRGLRLPVDQNGMRVFDENINKLLVVANESYDDFARSLQTEYEEDCGVTFGKVPKLAFSKLVTMDGDVEKRVGREQSEKIWQGLVQRGMLDANGKILPKFNPQAPGFDLGLPDEEKELKADIIETLQSYQMDRHVKRDEDGKPLRFKKEVTLEPEFQELWNRIKPKTTFSVEYSTDELGKRASKALAQMEKIKPAKIRYTETQVEQRRAGIGGTVIREKDETMVYAGPLPDVVAYLQNETELTRSTLVRILKESGRLGDFFVNPQKFMEEVSSLLNRELHRLMIDGIKYERLGGEEWSMRLFEEKEIVSYLNNRLEVQKSVYDAVVYDSEIEREFAAQLDAREEIKLFVKLPAWFEIDTPIGKYNPDWAILRHDGSVLYLVRETKGTKNFEKLRGIEADKIRCGRKHFNSLDVDFDVVTCASEIA